MVYYPRLSAPPRSDPRWININHGGYNTCIVGSSGGISVLPNCTGYVHGRWMELSNTNTDNTGLADWTNNATNYWYNSDSSVIRSQTPALGACMCFANRNGGAGHVAIVEEIAADGSYVISSESNWGGEYFVTRKRYRNNDWSWYTNPRTLFQGFLIHPGISPDPPGPGPEPPGPDPGDRRNRFLIYYGFILNRKKQEILKNFKTGGIIK